jgi:hypothetical protein
MRPRRRALSEAGVMNTGRTIAGSRLINLVVPGGGLILIGHELLGVLIAILFTITTGYALAATLLFPDDTSAIWRGLGIGVAIGTYLGAQIRYAQTVRYQADQAFGDLRRDALGDARCALREGRTEDAWNALQPVVPLAETDLLVAYRVAQVLTARGDGLAALHAWRRVRRLDRHRIYRDEVHAHEQILTRQSPPIDQQNPPESLES